MLGGWWKTQDRCRLAGGRYRCWLAGGRYRCRLAGERYRTGVGRLVVHLLVVAFRLMKLCFILTTDLKQSLLICSDIISMFTEY